MKHIFESFLCVLVFSIAKKIIFKFLNMAFSFIKCIFLKLPKHFFENLLLYVVHNGSRECYFKISNIVNSIFGAFSNVQFFIFNC